MKYSIQAVSAGSARVEVDTSKRGLAKAKNHAGIVSRCCPLAFIHLYKREPFKLADGTTEKGRFRLVLVAKFKDGEEVK